MPLTPFPRPHTERELSALGTPSYAMKCQTSVETKADIMALGLCSGTWPSTAAYAWQGSSRMVHITVIVSYLELEIDIWIVWLRDM